MSTSGTTPQGCINITQTSTRWSDYLAKNGRHLRGRLHFYAKILGFSDIIKSSTGTNDARAVSSASTLYIRCQCIPGGPVREGALFTVPIKPAQRAMHGGIDGALSVICMTGTALVCRGIGFRKDCSPAYGNCLYDSQLFHYAEYANELPSMEGQPPFTEKNTIATSNTGVELSEAQWKQRTHRGHSSRGHIRGDHGNAIGGVQRSGQRSTHQQSRNAVSGRGFDEAAGAAPLNAASGSRLPGRGEHRGRGGRRDFRRSQDEAAMYSHDRRERC